MTAILELATETPSAGEERFDMIVGRLRAIATKMRTSAPSHAEELAALANELVLVRRDLRRSEPAAPPTRVSPQNAERHRVKEHDGLRFCNRCEGWKELSDFEVKDPVKGYLRSWCRDCRRDYNAQRYARVGTKVIAVELLEADGCIGRDCPRCREPFAAGDRVVGENLRHEHCQKAPR